MGMPFPRGLKLIGESARGEIVPVMWGVNGVASVIGSVLSVILSMSIGFTGALIIGAVLLMLFAKRKRINIPVGNSEDVPVHTMGWVKDIMIFLALIVVSVIIFYAVQSYDCFCNMHLNIHLKPS